MDSAGAKRPFSHMEADSLAFNANPAEYDARSEFVRDRRYADSPAGTQQVSSRWLDDFRTGDVPSRPILRGVGSACERVSHEVFSKLVEWYSLNDTRVGINLGCVASDWPMAVAEVEADTNIRDAILPYLPPAFQTSNLTLYAAVVFSCFPEQRDVQGGRKIPLTMKVSDLALRPCDSIIAEINGEPVVPTYIVPVGHIGLSNLGNTCFMNSSLQTLLHIPSLVSFFGSDEVLRDLNKSNPIGCSGEVAQAFADLVKQMYTTQDRYFAPSAFRNTIGKFNQSFATYLQQDSQEFTAFLLDSLHEDTNRVQVKPATSKPELAEDLHTTASSVNELAAKSWATHMQRNDSRVQELFTGMYKSTLVCPECSTVSTTFDPFFDQTLPLPSKNTWTHEVLYFPKNGRNVKTTVTLTTAGTVADMKLQLRELLQYEGQLVACDLFDFKIYQHLADHEVASDKILPSDVTAFYEVGNNSVPCFLRRKKGNEYVGCGTPFFIEITSEMQANPVHHRDEIEALISAEVPGEFKTNFYYARTDEFTYRYQEENLIALEEEDFVYVASPVVPQSPADSASSPTFQILPSPHSHGESPDSISPVTPSPGGKEKEQTPELPPPLRDTSEIVLVVDLPEANEEEYEIVTNPATVEAQKWALNVDEITLDSCLHKFSQPEVLGEADLWYCPRCKWHQQAQKQIELWHAPEVLMLHLKRFSGVQNLSRKIDEKVHFPLEGLDLAPHVCTMREDKPPLIYDLIGVINHFGGLSSGHYTAFVRDPFNNGEWLDFDDSRVTAIDPDRVVSSSAYVLFYQRRGTTSNALPVIDALRRQPPPEFEGRGYTLGSQNDTQTDITLQDNMYGISNEVEIVNVVNLDENPGEIENSEVVEVID